MKRVLIVAYFFPPLSNSGTQRPLKFGNFLPSYGWSPTVLTVADPPDRAMDAALVSEVRAEVRVERVPLGSLLHARRLASLAGPWRARVADALEWRLRALKQFPDGYSSWSAPAVRRALQLHAERAFDAVFGTGFPWTALLISRQVARRIDRPWVADFRDPWTGDQVFDARGNDRRWQRRSVALERRVLTEANHITTVTAPLGEHLRRLGGDGCAPISVIPNGYDRDDLIRADDVPRPSNGRVRVVYTGVWKDGYNPGALYEAVERLVREQPTLAQTLEVVMAGFPPGEAATRKLAHVIDERGHVPHTAATGLMRSADLLFLSLAGGLHQQVQVPGKLYEYFAVGRPVVAMADAGGATAQLLADLDGGVLLPPGDVAGLARVLERLCRVGPQELPRVSEAEVAAYERRALTRRLADLLDHLAPASSSRPHLGS